MRSNDSSTSPSTQGNAPLVFGQNAATVDTSAPRGSQSVGALLREARVQKGLSPSDLAQSLNLDLRIVEHLEADRLDEAPAAIYVRAYLKHWAEQLNINAAPLLAAFEAQRTKDARLDSVNTHARAPLDIMASRKPTHSAHRSPRAKNGRIWGWLVTLLLVAGVLTVIAFALPSAWQQKISSTLGLSAANNSGGGTAHILPTQAPIAIEVPIRAPAEGSPAAAQNLPASTTPTEPAPIEPQTTPLSAGLPPPPALTAAEPTTVHPADAATSQLTNNSAASPTPAEPSPTQTAPAPVASAADQTLVIKANSADCWVEVTNAQGKRLIYDVLKKGSERSLPGPGPFTVILGNPNAVTVTWQGAPVKLGTPNATTGVVRTKVGG